MPLGTLGTAHALPAWVPEILPVESATSTQTTSLPNAAEPICTNTSSPAGHPEPDTVNPVPGVPEVGDTEALTTKILRVWVAAWLWLSWAETLWVPAVALAGTVKVTGLVVLPFASVPMLVGVVASAAVSNLNPDTVALAANP